MAESVAHQHKLGEPWSDDQIEQTIQGPLERNELDGADAIIWLRFELARATPLNQPTRWFSTTDMAL
jgi:hypothetical protein